MTTLLDANVLVALLVGDHVHHRPAGRWLSANGSGFATCPITQGSLVRLLLRQGQPAATARELVGALGRG
ncbi:PIN domain-containing protein [Mycolicibacter algericus]|uniref:PIN domain-containing protein n=1 Tax=Mycolicibacter algericus TaxID=1288388 RepID=UPI0031017FEA